MNLSPLQKARYEYSPKLPGMLRGGISEISVKVGAPTESVADQDKIKALFPNTYGKNEITFVKRSVYNSLIIPLLCNPMRKLDNHILKYRSLLFLLSFSSTFLKTEYNESPHIKREGFRYLGFYFFKD